MQNSHESMIEAQGAQASRDMAEALRICRDGLPLFVHNVQSLRGHLRVPANFTGRNETV